MVWIAVPTWLVALTEADGAVTHWVGEEQVLAPLDGRRSRAVCGRAFLPAALATPPGRPCPHCRRALAPPARERAPRRLRFPRLPRFDRRTDGASARRDRTDAPAVGGGGAAGAGGPVSGPPACAGGVQRGSCGGEGRPLPPLR